MNPPEILSSQMMCILTHYDNMSGRERESVFNAYKYERQRNIYILQNSKLLTESTIKKLNNK
jgi:hypothetical protein